MSNIIDYCKRIILPCLRSERARPKEAAMIIKIIVRFYIGACVRASPSPRSTSALIIRAASRKGAIESSLSPSSIVRCRLSVLGISPRISRPCRFVDFSAEAALGPPPRALLRDEKRDEVL